MAEKFLFVPNCSLQIKKMVNKKNIIQSDELIIKPLSHQDVGEIYINNLNDKTYMKHMNLQNDIHTKDSVYEYIGSSDISELEKLYGIFTKGNNTHIGNIRLSEWNKVHKRLDSTGMLIFKEYSGKGFGYKSLKLLIEYVFKNFDIIRIGSWIYEYNKSSLKIFKKVGFNIEGFEKYYQISNGGPLHRYTLAIYNDNNYEYSSHKNNNIPSAGPSITDADVQMVNEAVRIGWHENRNTHYDQFIGRFKDYIGMKYCLPTSHCTSAIHLAMLALGIKENDEVIVPDVTWVASVAPICYVGAKPVFVDIDKKDWCISPKSFEAAITDKTKAVVVVDLYGNMPQMDEILLIAKNNNIKIIEDAAEGLGAEYNGKKAGTFGHISVFSFNATKIMISGQGGMLVTNEKKYYDKCKLFSHHGINTEIEGKYFWSYEIGYNYNWTNIQAALALSQFQRINELVTKRRQIFNWYQERLTDIDGIRLNHEKENTKSTYWVVTAILDKKYQLEKEQIMEKLKNHNIDSRPFFYPISSMPPYIKYSQGKVMDKINPISYGISPYGISFPSAATITESDVEYICNCFKNIIHI